ncbi:maleylpyruvate isomerase N-terminal domain-containing protein [Streptomyces sp. NPDC004546]|uniref:maleylpyruvate isomerase N-terminal domain-containing protein n=1 Tax=unclassified Streptomyces TaxID=2593676 RepID=UPI0033ABC9F1
MLRLAHTGRAPGPRTDSVTLATAVERDAALSAERLTARLRESLDRFAAQARAPPAPAWDRLVPAPPGRRHPAWYLPLRCLWELETHHLDLGVGHGTGQWPDGYVYGAGATSVAGAGHQVLGRLSGRTPAGVLTTDGPARLLSAPPAWPRPPLPGWGRVDDET